MFICPAEQAGQIRTLLEAKLSLWEQIPEEPQVAIHPVARATVAWQRIIEQIPLRNT
ncbi:MAG: hypothetical protein ACPGWR_33435 [Ardenticatenaceae bacterium]